MANLLPRIAISLRARRCGRLTRTRNQRCTSGCTSLLHPGRHDKCLSGFPLLPLNCCNCIAITRFLREPLLAGDTRYALRECARFPRANKCLIYARVTRERSSVFPRWREAGIDEYITLDVRGRCRQCVLEIREPPRKRLISRTQGYFNAPPISCRLFFRSAPPLCQNSSLSTLESRVVPNHSSLEIN